MTAVRVALESLVEPDATTNARLWLDAFCVNDEQGDQEAIGNALRAHFADKKCTFNCPEGYSAFVERWQARLERFRGPFADGTTRLARAQVEGRMVVGVGHAATRETNLHLDRTFGVPLIPGSALKGIAAAQAGVLGGAWRRGSRENTEGKGEDHALLFGGAAGSEVDRAGAVIFHDAWWMPASEKEPLPLHLDVMTVHHPEYYAGRGAPLDWDEPHPVSFLSATGVYLVALTGPSAWVDVAYQLLERGLRELGIGAKTRAGYGRVGLTLLKTKVGRILERKARVLEINRAKNAKEEVLSYLSELLAESEVQARQVASELVADRALRKWWKVKLEATARLSRVEQLLLEILDDVVGDKRGSADRIETPGHAKRRGKKIAFTPDGEARYIQADPKAVKMTKELEQRLREGVRVIGVLISRDLIELKEES